MSAAEAVRDLAGNGCNVGEIALALGVKRAYVQLVLARARRKGLRLRAWYPRPGSKALLMLSRIPPCDPDIGKPPCFAPLLGAIMGSCSPPHPASTERFENSP